ncbi:MAG: hypothetical protein IKZ49_01715 [Alphaproteobacteria bacterium]|nr:hypothetical protein [Alphaproteobacteria bacterium]
MCIKKMVPLNDDNIFYTTKTIIMSGNKKVPVNLLEKTSKMHADLKLDDVDISKILVELENRYHFAIPYSFKAEEALTLGDFCRICADALNQKIELRNKIQSNDVVKSAIPIIAFKKDLIEEKINQTSRLKSIFHSDSLGMDFLDKQELIMELQKIYRVSISEDVLNVKANTLGEFCCACANEINKKIPLDNQINPHITFLPENPNIFTRMKYFLQDIRAK